MTEPRSTLAEYVAERRRSREASDALDALATDLDRAGLAEATSRAAERGFTVIPDGGDLLLYRTEAPPLFPPAPPAPDDDPPARRWRIWARGIAAGWAAWIDVFLLADAWLLRHHPATLAIGITTVATAIIAARRATLAGRRAR